MPQKLPKQPNVSPKLPMLSKFKQKDGQTCLKNSFYFIYAPVRIAKHVQWILVWFNNNAIACFDQIMPHICCNLESKIKSDNKKDLEF